VTVIHYDVNGRHAPRGVHLQVRLGVNGAILRAPNLIVHRRKRKHLDLVIDGFNALDALHGARRIVLQVGPNHLTHERDRAALHSIFEVIEQCVKGEHNQLVAHFVGYRRLIGATFFV
jgi:hypothetical protein